MRDFSCSDFRASRVLRRDALRVGGLGMFGVTLPHFLAAERARGAAPVSAAAADGKRRQPRAKSVIFLYQFGGPSHVDTLDMKPDAPDGIRSQFGQIETSLKGLRICEHLPRLARVMHQVTLVRGLHHAMKNHNSAAYYALTGRTPPVDDIRLRDSLELFPAYGSVVSRLMPSGGAMPAFAAHPYVCRDGSVTPGQHASFLGKAYDPLLVTSDPNGADFRLPELSLPRGLSLERLESRRTIQALIDRQSRLMETSAKARGIDSYYDTAIGMLTSPQVARAFDLSQEPAAVRERYGRTTYGQSCLLARRLVENGVRFVNVYFSDSIGGQSTTAGGWDTHGFNNTRMYPILKARHLPITDETLPTLLDDLDERGLVDQTLVVWVGEFGRTPRINENVSRDHWPGCYTALLAGGGVKRGYLHGASDKHGAMPAREPVRPDDLAATMFAALGLDPQTEVFDTQNRPLTIAAGRPIAGVWA